MWLLSNSSHNQWFEYQNGTTAPAQPATITPTTCSKSAPEFDFPLVRLLGRPFGVWVAALALMMDELEYLLGLFSRSRVHIKLVTCVIFAA